MVNIAEKGCAGFRSVIDETESCAESVRAVAMKPSTVEITRNIFQKEKPYVRKKMKRDKRPGLLLDPRFG
jgi:hypothetical protein